ncbi:hypothetical protein [Thalassococcus sp. S3]|uniref:hypothetical protein n=1 Tax=Thalassococcus sp. S3 TaxID=2017482 RepID=UPI0010247E0F|nr:hypothetical protein [Thalassococcus sp. S3]QBF34127.1 hypothetical protein CFI11_23375 [Thalassococcus sp. S3]
MKGWQIFEHSVRLVLENLREVLQIALLPLALACGIIFAALLALGLPLEYFLSGRLSARPDVTARSLVLFLALSTIAVLAFVWVAVLWHRFVLLGERAQGWFPRFPEDRILAYVARLLLLSLLAALIAVPVIFVIVAFGLGGPFGVFSVPVLVFLVSLFLFRFFPMLPAAAIGQPLGVSDAWSATSGSMGAILVLIAMGLVMNVALGVLFYVLDPLLPAFAMVVNVLGNLLIGLIHISMITSYYDYFIEDHRIA